MTERERFLHWYESEFGADQDARLERPVAWAAWQARCPEGYSVVPNEPTEQMLDAWFEVDRDDLPCQFVTPYKAMLSAAPQPGDDQ